MLKTKLQNISSFVLDILFPAICQKCGAEGSYLCDKCLAGIEPPLHKCFVCMKPSPYGLTHPDCSRKRTTALDGLLVAGRYEDEAIRNLVWLFKYNSAREIGSDLAKIIYDFLGAHDLGEYFTSFTICPVPMHNNKLKLRGYNQSELLSREVSSKLGPSFAPLLTKTRPTIPQMKLTRQERLLNLNDAFSLNEREAAPEKILLIDDVATTGTTLNECAKVLKKAGAREVWGLVIAKN